jgi:tetratricopeptide (TPR) repeat protein
MPFYKENSDVTESFKELSNTAEIERFAGGLEKSVFMCNSDKYSFCMNIKYLPEVQRGMLLELFNREIEQMKEISEEDEKLFKDMKDKYIFTQYIQDLYRFFKLHPLRSNFSDFFNTENDFFNKAIYEYLIPDSKFLQTLGNLYFQKGFYSDAVGILERFQKEDVENIKNLEKIGYSYQKIGSYEKAKEFYLKAEIFGASSDWLLKQTAFCYRKLSEYESALKYYLLAETHDADNMQLQAGIGHCYLSLGDYENALKRYFRVEFYAPDNVKVKKPIAWCSLIIGKFETAIKYYQKVCENSSEPYDLINYAHALYCINRKEEAVEVYLRAIQNSSIETFHKVMQEDKEMLKKHFIEESEIDMIIDMVKLKLL